MEIVDGEDLHMNGCICPGREGRAGQVRGDDNGCEDKYAEDAEPDENPQPEGDPVPPEIWSHYTVF